MREGVTGVAEHFCELEIVSDECEVICRVGSGGVVRRPCEGGMAGLM